MATHKQGNKETSNNQRPKKTQYVAALQMINQVSNTQSTNIWGQALKGSRNPSQPKPTLTKEYIHVEHYSNRDITT